MPAAHATWKAARPFTLDEPFERVTMETAVASAAERTAIPEWVAAVAERGGDGVVGVVRSDFVDRIKEWARLSMPRAKAIDSGAIFRKGLVKCAGACTGERILRVLAEYVVEPFLCAERLPDARTARTRSPSS